MFFIFFNFQIKNMFFKFSNQCFLRLCFDCELLGACIKCVCCCSQGESCELFQELVSEYSFTLEQLLELAGFSCAVGIAKVCRSSFSFTSLSPLISISLSLLFGLIAGVHYRHRVNGGR